MSNELGRFIWYELLTNDTEAARSFYQELIGWGHTSWEGEDFTYEMFTRGEEPYAGLMELPEDAQMAGTPSNWLGYVYVPDREKALARAVELGATKMAEIEIPEVGRFAVIRDPQGALIALYTPENDPGPESDPAIGSISWHELMTADHEAAWSFYSEMFGWELMEDMDMGEHGIYRIYGRNGRQLGGMMTKPAEMPVCTWVYYASVPDCASAVEQIDELGGHVLNGPMEVPGGDLVAQATDPTGAMFAIHSRANSSAGD